MKILIITLFLSLSTYSYGAFLELGQQVCSGNTTVCGLVSDDLDQLYQDLEDDMNAKLPDVDGSQYLTGMSNSAVMSSKGVGIDYASNMDWFVVGATVGAGVDLGERNQLGDVISGDIDASSVAGVAPIVSVIVGINPSVIPFFKLPKIGPIDLEKINFYMNYFGASFDKNGVTGDLSNLGFHAQYQLLGTKSFLPFGVAKWGGVKVNVGYEYTYLKLSFEQSLGLALTETLGGSYSTTIQTDTDVAIGLEIGTHSIPVEISTDFQWLYLFTTYVGFGADLSFGMADVISNADVAISGDIGGVSTTTNTGVVDLGQSGNPSPFMFRAFIGQQFNLTLLKIGVHLDYGVATGMLGAKVNFRVAW